MFDRARRPGICRVCQTDRWFATLKSVVHWSPAHFHISRGDCPNVLTWISLTKFESALVLCIGRLASFRISPGEFPNVLRWIFLGTFGKCTKRVNVERFVSCGVLLITSRVLSRLTSYYELRAIVHVIETYKFACVNSTNALGVSSAQSL